MKPTKLLCTAILALLTLSAFGQEERELFVTIKYSEELNRFETWASYIQDHFVKHNSKEVALPVISETYYTEYAFISYEQDELTLEDWMSNPFEANDPEEDIILEDWMSRPFGTEEELKVEEWMSKALWE